MDLQYFGANSIRLTTKKSVILVDPSSDIVDFTSEYKKANTVLATRPELAAGVPDEVFLVSGPGEYEFEDYSIKGIAAQPRTASSGDMTATMYRVINSEATVLFTGHIDSKLSEDQLEAIGVIDVLVVPVGGNGYTLDAVGAASVARALEPKLVVPVHSSADKLSYSVPQADLELFRKELGVPVSEESTDKLKLKAFPEQMTIQVINKS